MKGKEEKKRGGKEAISILGISFKQ